MKHRRLSFSAKSIVFLITQIFLILVLMISCGLSLSFLTPAYAEPAPTTTVAPESSPAPQPTPEVSTALLEPSDPTEEPAAPDPMGKRPFMIALLSIALVLSVSLLIKVLLTPSVRRKRRRKSVLQERPLRKVSHQNDLDLIDYYHPQSSPLDRRQRIVPSHQGRRENDGRVRARKTMMQPDRPTSSRPPQKRTIPQRERSLQSGYPRPQPLHTRSSSARRKAESFGKRPPRPSGRVQNNVRRFPDPGVREPRRKS